SRVPWARFARYGAAPWTLWVALVLAACTQTPPSPIPAQIPPAPAAPIAADGLDILIRGGTVYDGTGDMPVQADVGVRGDRIVAVGRLNGGAPRIIDARGLAVAPGFINMLSWAPVSLIHDRRSQSDIRQGVTTEIFGEGSSMGPLNEEMRRRAIAAQTDIKYEISRTTPAENLLHLQPPAPSLNVPSFTPPPTIP